MKVVGIPFGKGGLGKGDGSISGPRMIADKLGEGFGYTELEIDESYIPDAHKQIEDYVTKLDEKVVVLGGDHSITYSTVKAFAKKNKDFMFIVFDAHPDLMEDFIPPTHEAYLRAIIDGGMVEAEDVVLLGIRNSDKQESEYISEKGINRFTADELNRQGLVEIFSEILAMTKKDIYLSLDIDAIDPSEAPGTGYVEPNGLKAKEVLECLRMVKGSGRLKMADLVEVNPSKDVDGKTVLLAAKCLEELKDY